MEDTPPNPSWNAKDESWIGKNPLGVVIVGFALNNLVSLPSVAMLPSTAAMQVQGAFKLTLKEYNEFLVNGHFLK